MQKYFGAKTQNHILDMAVISKQEFDNENKNYKIPDFQLTNIERKAFYIQNSYRKRKCV